MTYEEQLMLAATGTDRLMKFIDKKSNAVDITMDELRRGVGKRGKEIEHFEAVYVNNSSDFIKVELRLNKEIRQALKFRGKNDKAFELHSIILLMNKRPEKDENDMFVNVGISIASKVAVSRSSKVTYNKIIEDEGVTSMLLDFIIMKDELNTNVLPLLFNPPDIFIDDLNSIINWFLSDVYEGLLDIKEV